MISLNLIKNILSNSVRNSPNVSSTIQFKRTKSKTTNRFTDSSSSDHSEDSLPSDKSTTIMKINISNTRVDLIIKSGLGIARNKIEKLFYENKIRVNGQKINKKSEQVGEGDEIDVIKGPSPSNPDFLVVSRVDILSMKPDSDSISVKLRRCRSLLVDSKSY